MIEITLIFLSILTLAIGVLILVSKSGVEDLHGDD